MITLTRRAPLVCAALLTCCLIAACGTSSSTSSRSTTTSSAAASAGAGAGAGRSGRFSALRACLKQHGVTLPSRPPGSRRPGTGGGGFGFFGGGGGGVGGLAARNPKLAAAIQACGGFRGGPGRFRLSRTAINNYVTCVRQHGYHLPNPNLSGRGPVFPPSIRSNPKFQSASRACQSLLVPPRAGTPTTARN
jgi:hypothetical protein